MISLDVSCYLSIIMVNVEILGGKILDSVLLIELELKRQLMIKSGIENGLQSYKTLQLSKQVDRLMNAFEERHDYFYDTVSLYGED